MTMRRPRVPRAWLASTRLRDRTRIQPMLDASTVWLDTRTLIPMQVRCATSVRLASMLAMLQRRVRHVLQGGMTMTSSNIPCTLRQRHVCSVRLAFTLRRGRSIAHTAQRGISTTTKTQRLHVMVTRALVHQVRTPISGSVNAQTASQGNMIMMALQSHLVSCVILVHGHQRVGPRARTVHWVQRTSTQPVRLSVRAVWSGSTARLGPRCAQTVCMAVLMLIRTQQLRALLVHRANMETEQRLCVLTVPWERWTWTPTRPPTVRSVRWATTLMSPPHHARSARQGRTTTTTMHRVFVWSASQGSTRRRARSMYRAVLLVRWASTMMTQRRLR